MGKRGGERVLGVACCRGGSWPAASTHAAGVVGCVPRGLSRIGLVWCRCGARVTFSLLYIQSNAGCCQHQYFCSFVMFFLAAPPTTRQREAAPRRPPPLPRSPVHAATPTSPPSTAVPTAPLPLPAPPVPAATATAAARPPPPPPPRAVSPPAKRTQLPPHFTHRRTATHPPPPPAQRQRQRPWRRRRQRGRGGGGAGLPFQLLKYGFHEIDEKEKNKKRGIGSRMPSTPRVGFAVNKTRVEADGLRVLPVAWTPACFHPLPPRPPPHQLDCALFASQAASLQPPGVAPDCPFLPGGAGGQRVEDLTRPPLLCPVAWNLSPTSFHSPHCHAAPSPHTPSRLSPHLPSNSFPGSPLFAAALFPRYTPHRACGCSLLPGDRPRRARGCPLPPWRRVRLWVP